MGLQPFNGHEIAIELAATEAIPPYRIVKFNATDKTKCDLAGAGATPLAVAIPNPDEMAPDGAGGFVKRTGWRPGERPTLYNSGTVWVELGGTVTTDDMIVPGANGKGVAEVPPTFSTPPTPAEITAALATLKTRLGKPLKAGVTGNIIPVKLF